MAEAFGSILVKVQGAPLDMPIGRSAEVAVRMLSSRDPLASPWLSRALYDRYLLFDAFVGGERRVDVHPIVLSRRLHEEAVAAATAVYGAISRVAALAHDDAEERARYGFSADVLQLCAASHAAADDAGLSRVDLLLGKDGGWRACEINADCPGGLNEATGLPELAQSAGFWEGLNPTRVLDALCDRLAELALRPGPGRGAVALLHATAYAEDLQICALVRRALLARGITAILASPTAPRSRSADGAICIGETRVAVLYRFFPTEYMDGQRNLGAICEALRRGTVRTLSGFSHIFAQSKLSFARAFAKRNLLDEADRQALLRYVPETFELSELPVAKLLAERSKWVLKRTMGRVGDEVFVGDLLTDEDWAQLQNAISEAVTTRGERWIAQRYIDQQTIATSDDEALLTLGVYLLDGRFVGYFARLSKESHVSHDALCLPVFVMTA